jgi:ABC-type glycerol-3-phosphate transport system substrate-binding protein
MLTKYSTAFAAGNSPVDVMSDADQSTGIFGRAGWLEPLDGIIPEESWDDFPESMKSAIPIWYGVDGVRYRFPHEFAIGYTWIRSDWFAEKGVSTPTTWEEVVEVGKTFADPEKGIWGTTDGLMKGGLLYVYVAYLAIQAGGSVFDFDEGTGTALQFLYDMIYTHKIFPEDALNNDYTQQNQLYTEDKVAFMRQWPFFLSVAQGLTDWYAPEKIKIELPPAGPAGSKSWWGGWGWSIPKFAPNMDGAKELVKFLSSNETAPRLADGQSWFIMPRASILKHFEGKDNPIVNAMGLYAAEGVPAPRPYHVRVGEAETLVSDMASLFLTNQASLSDVLKQGQELIKGLSE